MRAAYDFGADAVYAGQPRYSLRARNNEFRLEQIAQGIQEAHARGKKFFVTSNLIAHNDKVRTYLRDIEPVIACKPDAFIMADPGLIMMVKKNGPRPKSTSRAGQHHQLRHGQVLAEGGRLAHHPFARAEPGRDRKIRQECPDMELEVFVHGALCIAYSGRCLLSGYFNRRDPNQGTCTNACRWNYATQDAAVDPNTGEAMAARAWRATSTSTGAGKATPPSRPCGGGQRHPWPTRSTCSKKSAPAS
jgi:putative protease